MVLTAEPITLDNIDKSSWTTYRFDQIAKNISERVEPTETSLEIYVGLEHIDSDSIHIKRFGKREDVSGTKLRCYPGDVIFGRRRAYQRKAAIVTFDGFCSAHSLVLRANPNVILPELFPFFLHSDTFMHRAVDISVGSLSPTINWGDLKKQEFLLPPKDQQAQIAELLWAGDEMIERDSMLHHKVNSSIGIIINFECHKNSENQYKTVLLHNIISSLKAGISVVCMDSPYTDESIGVLKTSAITGKSFMPYEAKPLDRENLHLLKESLKEGDILINRKNTKQLVGSSKYVDKDYPNLFCPDLIWQLRINEEMSIPKYIWHYISTKKSRQKISTLSSGTNSSMVNISQKDFLNIQIQIPRKEIQIRILKEIDKLESARKFLENKIRYGLSLQKSLINQFF